MKHICGQCTKAFTSENAYLGHLPTAQPKGLKLTEKNMSNRKIHDYKFFRKDLNQWITTPEEVWQWEAYYENGKTLKQFASDGTFHQFAEIDQSQLAMFKMVSPHHPQTYTLLFSDPDMKLIHFYRNTILNAGTESEQRTRLYCFGYEKKIGHQTHKLIMMISPSNGLIVTEDPDLISKV